MNREETPLTRPRAIAARLLMVLLFLLLSGPACAEGEYVDIVNPYIRKIPLAIPYFKTLSSTPEAVKNAQRAADIMSESLDFTGYFKLVDRGAFISDPRVSGIMTNQIEYRNWSAVGAELLITGGVLYRGGSIEMELRLLDIFKQRLIVGKRYRGPATNQREIIHRFCSDVVFALTGNRGIFNSQISFVSNGPGNKEVFVCDFDGYGPRQVTRTKAITLFPSRSSDGNWIAYTSYRKGKPDLYIRHLREKRGAVVAKKGTNNTPAWRPGALQLAASLSFSGDQEIYLLTATGKITKRLTRSKGIDVSPSWSPDGQQMAFVSKRSGTPQIHIMDVASGKVRRLTFEGNYNTQPSWSPKGDMIAYTSMAKGQIDINVIDTEGRQRLQLTHGGGDDESPSWSPDGTLLVFSSTREGPSRVYVMSAFGTDQRRLLALPGQQSSPEWSANFER